ncbi:MAG TPA: hypothetical protein PLD59_00060 [Tepidisphaeraceae bacterium]|nr:hypothetical protein [Tepidisphaeraceae bacterium]
MTATAAAKGKVLRAEADHVVFQPSNTNYELHLKADSFAGPVGVPVECTIRAQARKIYSVSTGGGFIQPLFGPPKIIQGRVVSIEGQHFTMHAAGASVVVALPEDESGIDLNTGAIAIGSMVNVVAFAGAVADFKS